MSIRDTESFRSEVLNAFVVIPAYNEATVIRNVVAPLCGVFKNVVVINDGSSDETAEVLKGLPIYVISHSLNVGQGAAIQTGITFALKQGAQYIVTFDADGQHRIEDAIAALREVASGCCGAACGSRFLDPQSIQRIPKFRRIVLKLAVIFQNLTSGTRLTDAHNGLRAFNRGAAACINITQDGMAHASQITTQLSEHKIVVREVPVQIDYTEYSLSKGQSSLNAINIVIDLFLGRFMK